ncbi:unnamed protein product [Caenorhabditis angaria]|uniref:Uncharacterized protein n=1 Tax=Caenorhabditis angaria TaxID=860376 RepID=A0A9P1N4M0_9PELO|nr:unnamed protein product [Caenorhabditis angaria]
MARGKRNSKTKKVKTTIQIALEGTCEVVRNVSMRMFKSSAHHHRSAMVRKCDAQVFRNRSNSCPERFNHLARLEYIKCPLFRARSVERFKIDQFGYKKNDPRTLKYDAELAYNQKVIVADDWKCDGCCPPNFHSPFKNQVQRNKFQKMLIKTFDKNMSKFHNMIMKEDGYDSEQEISANFKISAPKKLAQLVMESIPSLPKNTKIIAT